MADPMERITGIVTNVSTQRKPSKSGKTFTINFVEVNDVGKGKVLVNVGFKQGYNVGDTFNTDCVYRFNEWQVPKDTPMAGGPVRTATEVRELMSPTPSFKAVSQRPFPVPKTSGEMAIIRQSALKAAIDTLGHYNLKDRPIEEVVKQILSLAYEYADFSSGHREEKEVVRMLAAKEV